MVKITRKTLKKMKGKTIKGYKRKLKKKGGNCGCSKKPWFGGKNKKTKIIKKSKKSKQLKTKKQKGGFFREIRNIFDYGYYLGEKQTATLGGYPQPKSPDPTKDQNPNSRA